MLTFISVLPTLHRQLDISNTAKFLCFLIQTFLLSTAESMPAQVLTAYQYWSRHEWRAGQSLGEWISGGCRA